MGISSATHPHLEVTAPEPGVVVVTLSRPAQLNALTFEMFTALERLLRQLDADDDVRAIVLTGAGRGFCSGLDLAAASAIGDLSIPQNLHGQATWASPVIAMRTIGTPVVAAVNGAAAGAGLALALAADVRLASPDARFTAAFVRIGLSGGDVGTSWLLPRVVGLGHASEMLLTARTVQADEAVAIGLVNRVVPADELLTEAVELAAGIARHSSFAVTATKRVLQRNIDATSIDAAVDLENALQVLACRTDDMAEALAAFREKRTPVWTGR